MCNRQSEDFVGATQDNLYQTPYIIPSSPTGQENEQGRTIEIEEMFVYKM